jgi:hypothetical protein
MFFRLCSRVEGSKVFTFAGLRVNLPRVEPVLSGLQFPNHNRCSALHLVLSALMQIIFAANKRRGHVHALNYGSSASPSTREFHRP